MEINLNIGEESLELELADVRAIQEGLNKIIWEQEEQRRKAKNYMAGKCLPSEKHERLTQLIEECDNKIQKLTKINGEISWRIAISEK